MNIFFLDEDPRLAAIYHCDKHLIKMILETAQLLSTAQRVMSNVSENSLMYKKTHVNHPCSIWIRQSRSNYVWAYNLFVELSAEYTNRYGKVHASFAKLSNELSNPPDNIPQKGLTEIAQAMPNKYKVFGDPIKAYRSYYIGEKQKFARWSRLSDSVKDEYFSLIGSLWYPKWWTD